MSKFQIPEAFLPGFQELAKISSDDAEKIGVLLNQLSVGVTNQDFREAIQKAELSKNLQQSADTIFSLGALLAGKDGGDATELASGLSDAYREQNKEEISDEEALRLKSNLLILLQNGDKLKKTYKAYQLYSDNVHTYRDSRVLTDIRLLFNDDVESIPTCGLILHQLKIEYIEDDEVKSFFVSLDIDDLLTLSENLQRALRKEESIKRNQDRIDFISVK